MLRPQPIGPVPEETARIAHAASPKAIPISAAQTAWVALHRRTCRGTFPTQGQPAFAPWRLALVTILPSAVRSRIDWKSVPRL